MKGAGTQRAGGPDPQATRARLVEQLAITSGQPPEDDGTPRAKRALKNWNFECQSLRELIGRFDSILAPAPPPPKPVPAPPPPLDVETEVALMRRAIDIARIPKGKRAEMRVSINEWKGARNVDVRLWYVPKGGGDWVPSRKGVAVEAAKLDALVNALISARQHMAGPM